MPFPRNQLYIFEIGKCIQFVCVCVCVFFCSTTYDVTTKFVNKKFHFSLKKMNRELYETHVALNLNFLFHLNELQLISN